MSLVARGSVDIRPLNGISEILVGLSWICFCPLIFKLIRGDKVEECLGSVAWRGSADTNEIIKAKINATRPARE